MLAADWRRTTTPTTPLGARHDVARALRRLAALALRARYARRRSGAILNTDQPRTLTRGGPMNGVRSGRYPAIVAECETAMRAIVPSNRVARNLRECNCYEVSAYSKSWPRLLPQHGSGKKHERKIVLANWQQELIDLSPELLLRGLIHSDGCRFINTGRGEWRCPRYSFSNLSADIKRIFCDACDRLDIHWTTAPPTTIYVSQSRRRQARRVHRAEALSGGTRQAASQKRCTLPGRRCRRSPRRRPARAGGEGRGPCRR